MFQRKCSPRNINGETGSWCRSLAALIFAATALCTMLIPVAASAATATKDGLYLYVCLPGNIAGDLTQGGSGLVVFNIDQGYKFVERIPLPQGPSNNGGDPPSCKGIDASVWTGLIYPQMTDRFLAVDLETSTLAWQQVYDGGCCDRGV